MADLIPIDAIIRIVKAGPGLILDASRYSTSDLKRLVSAADSLVILLNAESKSIADLESIANLAEDNVILDITGPPPAS